MSPVEMSSVERVALAAIEHPPGAGVDRLLADFAADLRGRGVRVGGVVQHNRGLGPECDDLMELVDLRTGQRVRISQDLGAGSLACRVDASGVAEAAMLVRAALDADCALLIINKFAALEAQGSGLIAELGAAVTSGVPVLTSVSTRHSAAWRNFAGDLAEILPPDPAALAAWWARVAG